MNSLFGGSQATELRPQIVNVMNRILEMSPNDREL